MFILGIESSCDDTSAALLECDQKGCFVKAEKTASQIEIHKKYGGVVPEIAGRMHAEKIVPLIEEVLRDQPHPEAIAATAGPGLLTGLLVGLEAGRTLAAVWNIPLVPVHHLKGHILSVELNSGEPISYPALALVVSGGHTSLVYLKKENDYKILGQTKDDAAGECFDKVAKLLDLPYPGGPRISKLAESGRTDAIPFPRPMLNSGDYDFSFSGLKTSALYWLRDNQLAAATTQPINQPAGIFGIQPNPPTAEDFCASFEQAIVDTLVGKTIKAAKEYQPKTVILGGGVAANKKLRLSLGKALEDLAPVISYRIPALPYCMDNAAMIAVAGYNELKKEKPPRLEEARTNPNWGLEETQS